VSDGLSSVGSAPFNIGSHIHEQTRAREAIEKHIAEQRVEKEHRANHAHLEALAKQSLELQKGYDRFGKETKPNSPQGTYINIEV